ncbi:DUF4062 domain-containing protein [Cellulomonas soli]|uniref:DUF4062 domain-containing protein n=1 Tax=Cellulomonas soli TaxID=931535 RepID=UPI003F840A53
MSYAATVLRVMIASPSDVPIERDAVEQAVHGWNDASARVKGYILQPWRWESSAVPLLGGHPQALINSQGVDDSDIVIAIFGSRLGSPTPEAASGTVSEIERATAQGKPVHLYFSTAPLPRDVDLEQLEGLRAFRSEMEQRGLLGEFANASQLEHEVWKAIEHDIAAMGPHNVTLPNVSAKVGLLVQPMQQRELKGHTRQGRPQYTTRRWIEVTNQGSDDAELVTFESVGDSGLHLGVDGQPTVIHAGQTRTIETVRAMGGADEPVVRVRWQVRGEDFERDFHIG